VGLTLVALLLLALVLGVVIEEFHDSLSALCGRGSTLWKAAVMNFVGSLRADDLAAPAQKRVQNHLAGMRIVIGRGRHEGGEALSEPSG
jgi:hypothetical protein